MGRTDQSHGSIPLKSPVTFCSDCSAHAHNVTSFQVTLFGASIKAPSYSRSIRALCRYTRESVNRVKLREIGGLRLLVRVLTSRTSADSELHDVVIESIKNFAYDDNSLLVLQNEG